MTRFLIGTHGQSDARPPICAAMVEDAIGMAHRPAPELVRYLRNMRGRLLPGAIADAARSTFGCDVSDVRLHTGPRVDELLVLIGAPACCIGHHILLARSATTYGAKAVRLLSHELTHIVAGRRYDVLRCWDARLHATLSSDACEAYRLPLDTIAKTVGLSWPQLIQGIKNASSNMDWRGRATSPGATIAYLRDKTKGEGPRHGEGLNYTSESWYENTSRNVQEQTRHVRMAIEDFAKDAGSKVRFNTARSGYMGATVGGVSLLERAWILSLANALHVSQDRASHREGTKGYGHDDPRAKMQSDAWNPDRKVHDHGVWMTGWEPDEGSTWERCGEAAYNKALNNSFDVIYEFLMGIKARMGLSIAVHPSLKKPVNCP